MAAEEYEDDVLELEYEFDQQEDEDDEMPTIQHGLLQRTFLRTLSALLAKGLEVVPPITFKGITQRYTPDVSIYSADVLNTFASSDVGAPAPLWAIEIISPGQTIMEMVKKCEGMIASGVEECWIVEPANESITVCTKERRFVRHEGEVLTNRFLLEPLKVEDIFTDILS